MLSKPSFDPIANPDAIIQSGNARFSVLKSRLIRMEYDPNGLFEDRPSQVFWYRNQAVPEMEVSDEGEHLVITTAALQLRYRKGHPFDRRHLQVLVKATGSTWHYGDPDFTNLKGTYRTLDRVDGRVSLEPGLLSHSGWSVVDDTQALVFSSQHWLERRNADPDYKDIYFFGYGHAYLDTIREYQELSGRPGLLPRWALGNWWSRYKAYTQAELSTLLEEFQSYEIPLSVCIIDMDWHVTRTGNSSSGWTGYTWNRDLFPDPDGFIRFLHALKLKTALNLHPAEGIHPHEAAYPELAQTLGVEPESQTPIPFDIASPDFVNAYFQHLHYPLEKQGIDFWWMDWQQGTQSKTEGLDPLYWLNHLHYCDLGRTPEKRPFIFSRWPGLGGHRYPIGFSGDTIVSWASLDFQPEFTATASNVAYGWWSHDIGGHFEGIEDPELFTRWVQLGVFSPILRLHATNNPYIDRRPWAYGADTLAHIRAAMQLRHALIPLLYSANLRNAETGEPPILSMYYRYPEASQAYLCPQEYIFCQQLLAAPFTSPIDPATQLSRQVVWLPEGDWYDFLSGEYYKGGAWYPVYGNLTDIPIFAQAGAIIPLSADPVDNGVDLPRHLRLRIFPGKDESFTLYEDDGETQAYLNGNYATTTITQSSKDGKLHIEILPAEGSFTGQFSQRAWTLELVGVSESESVEICSAGETKPVTGVYDSTSTTLEVSLGSQAASEALIVEISGVKLHKEPTNLIDKIERLIQAARLSTYVKLLLKNKLASILQNPAAMLEIAHYFQPSQLLALFETLTGGQDHIISRDVPTAYAEIAEAFSELLRRESMNTE